MTYKTNHPKIKEITIGDKFILKDKTIVIFSEYNDSVIHNGRLSPYRIGSYWYNDTLQFGGFENVIYFDKNISEKIPTLKEKLKLI